jgi:hypothetical protein
MKIAQVFKIYSFILVILCQQLPALAQKDTSSPRNAGTQKDTVTLKNFNIQQDSSYHKGGVEGFLKRQKGMMGKLAKNLVGDTTRRSDQETVPVRNDLTFSAYNHLIIRDIEIQRLDFGTLITDTTRNFKNAFTQLANKFHHKSREYVIRNNLFFKKGDRIDPFLMADNETQLRNQPYIQDAKIILKRSEDNPDSVDVLVRVKDVLSIGGSFELHNPQSAEMTVREDNLNGWGNTVSVGSLYDQARRQRSGIGLQYVNRNIAGSFVDLTAGYSTFASTFNTGQHEEKTAYIRLVRPLVNAYAKWTYSLEAANHFTQNMFLSDSQYTSDVRYHYYNYDAWVGWNTGAYKLTSGNADDRLRTLVSLRYFRQLFLSIPGKYANQYYYLYPDMTGILGSISIFKQNFYKAQYFYGFGRNEDVPEGTNVSLTAGWIDKQAKNRPYAGIAIQRYYFAPSKGYYNITFSTGSYWGDKKPEDLNMLLSVDHYSRLLNIGRWKERSLINASITGQFSQVLNPPLMLESIYGLEEYKGSMVSGGGDIRVTVRGETVFFSPFTFINFHFAPFVFGDLCMITPVKQSIDKSDLYSSIGGGIRTRNESLVFGTFELKAFYFPRKTFTGEAWRIETNTGLKFKFNSQLIKRPDVINVN